MPKQSIMSVCLVVLAVLAVFTILSQTKSIFAPVVSSLLLGVVLTPLSDFWDRIGLPPALAAFVSVSLAILTILVLILLIEPYVTQAINQAPVIWSELRGTIEEFKRMLRGLEEISEDVAEAIGDNGGADASAEDGESATPVVLPSLTDALFLAPHFAAQFLIFSGTLYFFLMTRNSIYDWVTQTFSRFGEDELRDAAKQVAKYVLTISAINFVFGFCVAIAMQLIGMPSPMLWGILAFALNFILYLGPISLIGMLLITGIVVFDGVASFLPAAMYMSMNAVEAQFVTPTLVGKSLSVNPLLVFLSLVFWLWLWGPIGGIIAIPLLIWSMTVLESLLSHSTEDQVLDEREAA